MTATYTKNTGSALAIPGGIFTKPDEFQIDVNSDGLVDVGIYMISLLVSDSLLNVTSSYTLNITNERPKLVSALPPVVTAP